MDRVELKVKYGLPTGDLIPELLKVSKDELINGMLHLVSRVCACDKKIVKLEKSCDALLIENENLKRDVSLGDKQLEWFRCLLNEPSVDYDALKAENEMLKSNASMPCNSCVGLHNDLDLARNEIVLLKSNASLPCVSCESLLAEIDNLKLTHSTCVDELKRARAEICEMKSMPCTKCSFILDDNVCPTSCDIHDTLPDVNDDAYSCGLICTSCIELENEVLALKQMRDDMSAKLAENNEMNANLEKENDLLRTTYAKCIEQEMDNLKNSPCGTCDRLKFENEILVKRCKSLCAKSFDSRDSCHTDLDASKIASSQAESGFSAERESLDVGICASALASFSIAIPKLVGSSGAARSDSCG